LALDAYDAAVLLVARAQDALSNLGASLSLSAAGGATGVKAAGSVNPLLDPSTPLGSFLTSVVGGAAYFADAAANGQWAKILCYKPFKTVAAVTLTVLRIVVSWFLSGAEFACSMLYATPAYAAAIAIVAIVALRKVVKSAAKTTTRRMEVAASAAAAPAPVAAPASASEASVETETEAAEIEIAPPEPMPMPASAVFEASTRVMTEEEKAIMLRRVQEAKSTARATTSFSSETYENSYASSSSSYDASSSYGSSVSVDSSDVDRIYKELTQKYGVESSGSGTSGAYAADAPLPASLPTTTKSSTFDADAFLAAFATDDSSSASYAAAASATESTYAVTTTESAYAAATASSSMTTETKSATKTATKSATK
jgi:hypothetical protein